MRYAAAAENEQADRIEAERQRLHILVTTHGGDLKHPKVVEQSQLLDRLLNELNGSSK